jgi:glycosyltransferase involved in cell wall biosynthesis
MPFNSLPISALPPFSALVAAWNEGDLIETHIKSFIDLEQEKSELILCAGGDDDTYEKAKRFESKNVTVIKQKQGEGKQVALRKCLQHASHDLIYLTDADCLFDEISLYCVFEPIISGTYYVSSGASRPFNHVLHLPIVQYQWARDVAGFNRTGTLSKGVFGRNSAITRTCLNNINNFSESVATGTDYHLSKKLRDASIPVKASKHSRVQAEYPTSAMSYLKMWRRWIKNLMIHDPRREKRHFLKITILAILLLFAPLSIFLLPWFMSLGFVTLFIAALITRYRDLYSAHNQEFRVNIKTYLLTPIFLFLDQLAVLGAGLDLLDRRKRNRW